MGQLALFGRSTRLVATSRLLAVVSLILASLATTAQSADAPSKHGVVSGTITLVDGAPSKVKGWLYSQLTTMSEPGNPNSISHSYSTEGEFRDKFHVRLKPGTAWLKFFADGYAPTVIGPFDITADGKIEDAKFVLSPGVRRTIRVVSTDGRPVAQAKMLALPYLGTDSNGPSIWFETNDRGEYVYEHLADAPHAIHITAKGYEPFRVEKQDLNEKEATELQLIPSLPMTGVVTNHDDTPAKGARILFRCEIPIEGSVQGQGYGFGQELAVTDAAGRFTLDSLTRGSTYLFIVESTDQQRIAVRTFRPGLEGVQVRLPKDQNLRVKLIGDISKLPKRKTEHFIGVRQRLTLEGPDTRPGAARSRGDLIGQDAKITPTDDGGVADCKGLVTGAVEITAGGQKQIANVVENGLTEVVIDLRKPAPE